MNGFQPLLCLIEGTRQPFEVSIHPNSTVQSLGKVIFNMRCGGLAGSQDNLSLLKVGILLVVVFIPLTF